MCDYIHTYQFLHSNPNNQSPQGEAPKLTPHWLSPPKSTKTWKYVNTPEITKPFVETLIKSATDNTSLEQTALSLLIAFSLIFL